MTKRALLPFRLSIALFISCWIGTLPSYTLARAAGEISVTSSRADIRFPSTAIFSLSANSPTAITSVSLQMSTPGKKYGAIPLDVQPQFTAGTEVTAIWTWQSPGPGLSLPPGAEISFHWTLANADGDSLQTPPQNVRYEDGRFTWLDVTGPGIHLFWYDGDKAFGAQLLQSAESGLATLREQQGTDLKSDVTVYIYSTQQALRGAMIGSPVWIGGRAYPEFDTILLVVDQKDLNQGSRALIHELTHQVVYQQTFSPLLGSHVPLWLNEGLAVTSEGPTAAQFKTALDEAVNENRVPSFKSFDSSFPTDGRASTLAYAQSESFVRFLLGRYGAADMSELLGVFQRGNRADAALREAYGADLDQLQQVWRSSLKSNGPSSVSGATTAPAASRVTVQHAGRRLDNLQQPLVLGILLVVVSACLLCAIALLLRSMGARARPQ